MNLLHFVRNNIRFSLTVVVNLLALVGSLYWMIDANFFNKGEGLELEPIVTTTALLGTLFGLNYVNDKLTRPDVRIIMSMALSVNPIGERMDGVSIDIRNYSIQKIFISGFYIRLVGQSNILAIVRNGFTGSILDKPILEPGQALNIIIDKDTIQDAGLTEKDIGDFVVSDQVGREYVSSAGQMASHVATLLQKT